MNSRRVPAALELLVLVPERRNLSHERLQGDLLLTLGRHGARSAQQHRRGRDSVWSAESERGDTRAISEGGHSISEVLPAISEVQHPILRAFSHDIDEGKYQTIITILRTK